MFGIDVSYHKGNIDWNKVWPELEQVEVDNSDWED